MTFFTKKILSHPAKFPNDLFHYCTFHHCTFQVITAHFVHHCTLKQALVRLLLFLYIRLMAKPDDTLQQRTYTLVFAKRKILNLVNY